METVPDQEAKNLGELIEYRAGLYRQARSDVQQLRDPSPAQQRELWRAAYYETFANTPLKRLLWEAEDLFNAVISGKESSGLHPWTRDALWVELIEARAVVEPDEGYRLLKKMPENEAKAEAIAKFSMHTSPIFIEQAVTLLTKIWRSNNGYATNKVAEGFEVVGRLGNDPKACELAMRAWKSIYEAESRNFKRGEKKGHFHSRRVARSSLDGKRDEMIEGFVRLAALGYLPAINEAKAWIIQFPNDNGEVLAWHMSRIYQMAIIEFVGYQIDNQQMDMLSGLENDLQVYFAQKQAIEPKWQNLINERHKKVSSRLSKGFKIPYAKQAFDTDLRLISALRDLSDYGHSKTDIYLRKLQTTDANIKDLYTPIKSYGQEKSRQEVDLACLFRAVKLKAIHETYG